MGGKDKEEKTWEVANIWMYHFSWNFFNLIRYAVVTMFDIIVFSIFSTSLKTLRSCEFGVDDTVDGKEN